MTMSRNLDPSKPIRPAAFVHFVLRVRNVERSIEWYQTVLDMEIVQRGPKLAFLTYDDEHHRIALFETPTEAESVPGAAGLDHVAYAFPDLGELLSTYKRLKSLEIVPYLSINHGPTTSLYYHDPDKNEVELGCDNFETREELNEWFANGLFAKNFYGYNFDPEVAYAQHMSGAPDAEVFAETYRGDAPDLESLLEAKD